MSILENSSLRLEINDNGKLTEFRNLHTGSNYAGGGSLLRLIYEKDGCLECVAEVDENATVSVESGKDSSLAINYNGLGGREFSATITVRLEGDESLWTIDLRNDDPESRIRECFFPMFSPLNLREDQEFIWSQRGGQKFADIREELRKCSTCYVALDEKGPVKMALYPGNTLALNFFMFAGKNEGLYLGSHDSTIQQTVHYLRLVDGEQVEASFVKYPMLDCGKSAKLEKYSISPYCGSWHRGADKYRNWLESEKRRSPVEDRPAWLNDFNGWQRIIMKHQYGKVLFGYDDLERIYLDGKEAGIDGALLFGWHVEGHDAGYPLYEFDVAQGGEEKFREGVKKIQARGGKVLLYFNGHLIEKGGEFYHRIGHRISAKDFRGNEYVEQYRFSGEGTALRQFGNRTFVGACPCCEEWFEHLKSLCDIAISLGVDSVFFDQMGGVDNVQCCDASHGHEIPFVAIGKTKAELLSRLRQYVRSKAPHMALGTEILCDTTACEVDYVHSLSGGAELAAPPLPGKKPVSEWFFEPLRYCLDDVIFSDREIRNDTDIPRRVNHALMNKQISDVEIYRCRATIAETPLYSEYLKEANRVRRKYANLLLTGKYLDSQGFICNNSQVDARAFASGNQLAVLLTQSHLAETSAVLRVEKSELVDVDGLGKYSCAVSPDRKFVDVRLTKDSLAVCIFRK